MTFRKAISLVVAIAFLANDLAFAIPEKIYQNNSTLAVPSRLTEDSFKEKFLIGQFLLSDPQVNLYIKEQILREQDILKGKWKDERTLDLDVSSYVGEKAISGKERIRNNVDGLSKIKLIKISGFLARTGQFAHVGLTGRDYGGTPVMYVDSSFYNWDNDALRKHEIEEILQWEDLRVNILKINIKDKSSMRTWMIENVDVLSAAARTKLAGTVFETCNSVRDIASLIHSRSHSIEKLYADKKKQIGEIGLRAAFDFEKISALFSYHSDDPDGGSKLNIAASGQSEQLSVITPVPAGPADAGGLSSVPPKLNAKLAEPLLGDVIDNFDLIHGCTGDEEYMPLAALYLARLDRENQANILARLEPEVSDALKEQLEQRKLEPMVEINNKPVAGNIFWAAYEGDLVIGIGKKGTGHGYFILGQSENPSCAALDFYDNEGQLKVGYDLPFGKEYAISRGSLEEAEADTRNILVDSDFISWGKHLSVLVYEQDGRRWCIIQDLDSENGINISCKAFPDTVLEGGRRENLVLAMKDGMLGYIDKVADIHAFRPEGMTLIKYFKQIADTISYFYAITAEFPELKLERKRIVELYLFSNLVGINPYRRRKSQAVLWRFLMHGRYDMRGPLLELLEEKLSEFKKTPRGAAALYTLLDDPAVIRGASPRRTENIRASLRKIIDRNPGKFDTGLLPGTDLGGTMRIDTQNLGAVFMPKRSVVNFKRKSPPRPDHGFGGASEEEASREAERLGLPFSDKPVYNHDLTYEAWVQEGFKKYKKITGKAPVVKGGNEEIYFHLGPYEARWPAFWIYAGPEDSPQSKINVYMRCLTSATPYIVLHELLAILDRFPHLLNVVLSTWLLPVFIKRMIYAIFADRYGTRNDHASGAAEDAWKKYLPRKNAILDGVTKALPLLDQTAGAASEERKALVKKAFVSLGKAHDQYIDGLKAEDEDVLTHGPDLVLALIRLLAIAKPGDGRLGLIEYYQNRKDIVSKVAAGALFLMRGDRKKAAAKFQDVDMLGPMTTVLMDEADTFAADPEAAYAKVDAVIKAGARMDLDSIIVPEGDLSPAKARRAFMTDIHIIRNVWQRTSNNARLWFIKELAHRISWGFYKLQFVRTDPLLSPQALRKALLADGVGQNIPIAKEAGKDTDKEKALDRIIGWLDQVLDGDLSGLKRSPDTENIASAREEVRSAASEEDAILARRKLNRLILEDRYPDLCPMHWEEVDFRNFTISDLTQNVFWSPASGSFKSLVGMPRIYKEYFEKVTKRSIPSAEAAASMLRRFGVNPNTAEETMTFKRAMTVFHDRKVVNLWKDKFWGRVPPEFIAAVSRDMLKEINAKRRDELEKINAERKKKGLKKEDLGERGLRDIRRVDFETVFIGLGGPVKRSVDGLYEYLEQRLLEDFPTENLGREDVLAVFYGIVDPEAEEDDNHSEAREVARDIRGTAVAPSSVIPEKRDSKSLSKPSPIGRPSQLLGEMRAGGVFGKVRARTSLELTDNARRRGKSYSRQTIYRELRILRRLGLVIKSGTSYYLRKWLQGLTDSQWTELSADLGLNKASPKNSDLRRTRALIARLKFGDPQSPSPSKPENFTGRNAGRLLRTLREKSGLTRAEVAARAGVSQTTVFKAESGRATPHNLNRIAYAMSTESPHPVSGASAPAEKTAAATNMLRNGIRSQVEFKVTAGDKFFKTARISFKKRVGADSVLRRIESCCAALEVVRGEVLQNSYDSIIDRLRQADFRFGSFVGKIDIEAYYAGADLIINIVDNGIPVELGEKGRPKKRPRDPMVHLGGKGVGINNTKTALRRVGGTISWHPLADGTRTEIRIPIDRIGSSSLIGKKEFIAVEERESPVKEESLPTSAPEKINPVSPKLPGIRMISLGGHAFIGPEDKTVTPQSQRARVKEAFTPEVVASFRNGTLSTHGNGPQAGMLLEEKYDLSKMTPDEVSRALIDDRIVERTEIDMGEMIKEAWIAQGVPAEDIVIFITEIEVDDTDKTPVKSLGVVNKVKVRSPVPKHIVRIKDIADAIKSGKYVIACGGGGIPVDKDGNVIGGVIDKDLATALLATELRAYGVDIDELVICTDQPYVYNEFGKPETAFRMLTPEQIDELLRNDPEGKRFPKGSIRPKMQAAASFIRGGGRSVRITTMENIRSGDGTLVRAQTQAAPEKISPVSPKSADGIRPNEFWGPGAPHSTQPPDDGSEYGGRAAQSTAIQSRKAQEITDLAQRIRNAAVRKQDQAPVTALQKGNRIVRKELVPKIEWFLKQYRPGEDAYLRPEARILFENIKRGKSDQMSLAQAQDILSWHALHDAQRRAGQLTLDNVTPTEQAILHRIAPTWYVNLGTAGLKRYYQTHKERLSAEVAAALDPDHRLSDEAVRNTMMSLYVNMGHFQQLEPRSRFSADAIRMAIPRIERLLAALFPELEIRPRPLVKVEAPDTVAELGSVSPELDVSTAITMWLRELTRGLMPRWLVALIAAPFIEEVFYRWLPVLAVAGILQLTPLASSHGLWLFISLPFQFWSIKKFMEHHRHDGEIYLPFRKKVTPMLVAVVNGVVLPMLASGLFSIQPFEITKPLATFFAGTVIIHSLANLFTLAVNLGMNEDRRFHLRLAVAEWLNGGQNRMPAEITFDDKGSVGEFLRKKAKDIADFKFDQKVFDSAEEALEYLGIDKDAKSPADISFKNTISLYIERPGNKVYILRAMADGHEYLSIASYGDEVFGDLLYLDRVWVAHGFMEPMGNAVYLRMGIDEADLSHKGHMQIFFAMRQAFAVRNFDPYMLFIPPGQMSRNWDTFFFYIRKGYLPDDPASRERIIELFVKPWLASGGTFRIENPDKTLGVDFRHMCGGLSLYIKDPMSVDHTVAPTEKLAAAPMGPSLQPHRIIKKKIKNILLINASYSGRGLDVRPPLGIWRLKAFIEKEFKGEIGVEILDLALESEDFDIRGYIKEKDFDLYGISASCSFYAPVASKLAGDIRKIKPASLIAAGGVHASAAPDDVIGKDPVDFIVAGDGEITLSNLIRAVSDGDGNIGKIKGLWYLDDSGRQVNTGECVRPEMDSLPLGMPEEFKNAIGRYDLKSPYFMGEPAWQMMTSLGCPIGCLYCSVRKISGAKFRAMSAERVIEEIKYVIKNYDIRNFNFDDDSFLFDPKRAKKIANYIITDPELAKVRFKITTRADSITEEIMELMAKAGLVHVSYGVESPDNAILKAVKKRTTVDDYMRATELAHRYGVRVRHLLMVGLPGQDKSSIDRTIQFLRETKPDEILVSIYASYPGTKYSEDPGRYGFDTSHAIDYTDILVRDIVKDGRTVKPAHAVATKWMTEEEIVRSRKRIIDEFKLMQTGGAGFLAKTKTVSVPAEKSTEAGRGYTYLIVNKPVDCLSQRGKDRLGRPNVYQLIPRTVLKSPHTPSGVTPVGRLDADTSGLMLFTDDGELHNLISLPASRVPRTYTVKVSGNISEEALKQLRAGVLIKVPAKRGENGDVDYMTQPAAVNVIERASQSSIIEIMISEGKNREIRKMCANVGHSVISLERKNFGPLELRGIKPGQWRRATPDEVKELLRIKEDARVIAADGSADGSVSPGTTSTTTAPGEVSFNEKDPISHPMDDWRLETHSDGMEREDGSVTGRNEEGATTITSVKIVKLTQRRPEIKAVVLDFDGTVAATLEAIMDAWAEIYAQIMHKGTPPTKEDRRFMEDYMKTASGGSVYTQIEYLMKTARDAGVTGLAGRDEYIRQFEELTLDGVKRREAGRKPGSLSHIPESLEFIRELRRQYPSLKIIQTSGKAHFGLERTIDYLGIRSYYDAIHGARPPEITDAPRDKKEVILELLTEGLKPLKSENVIMIGDGKGDLEAAREWGVICAMIAPDADREKELSTQPGVDFLIRSLGVHKDLIPYLNIESSVSRTIPPEAPKGYVITVNLVGAQKLSVGKSQWLKVSAAPSASVDKVMVSVWVNETAAYVAELGEGLAFTPFWGTTVKVLYINKEQGSVQLEVLHSSRPYATPLNVFRASSDQTAQLSPDQKRERDLEGNNGLLGMLDHSRDAEIEAIEKALINIIPKLVDMIPLADAQPQEMSVNVKSVGIDTIYRLLANEKPDTRLFLSVLSQETDNSGFYKILLRALEDVIVDALAPYHKKLEKPKFVSINSRLRREAYELLTQLHDEAQAKLAADGSVSPGATSTTAAPGEASFNKTDPVLITIPDSIKYIFKYYVMLQDKGVTADTPVDLMEGLGDKDRLLAHFRNFEMISRFVRQALKERPDEVTRVSGESMGKVTTSIYCVENNLIAKIATGRTYVTDRDHIDDMCVLANIYIALTGIGAEEKKAAYLEAYAQETEGAGETGGALKMDAQQNGVSPNDTSHDVSNIHIDIKLASDLDEKEQRRVLTLAAKSGMWPINNLANWFENMEPDAIVAYVDGNPVGAYSFIWRGENLSFDEALGNGIWVDDSVRKNGVATVLRNELFAYLKSKGYRMFRVTSVKDTRAAQRFQLALAKSNGVVIDYGEDGKVKEVTIDLQRYEYTPIPVGDGPTVPNGTETVPGAIEATTDVPENVASAVEVLERAVTDNFKRGEVYTIRYDARRLAEAGEGEEFSALKALMTYVEGMRMRTGDDKWRDRVKLVKCDSTDGRLISIERYFDISRSNLLGSSQVNVSGSLKGARVDVVTMMNMVLAACEIPAGTPSDKLKDYSVMAKVEHCYSILTGRGFEYSGGISRIILSLPSAAQLSTEELRDYYRLTIEALRKYA